MELKIRIKGKGKEAAKTYETDTLDISFGTVEDILDKIDVEKINMNDEMEVAKTVLKSVGLVKPILTDIFEGLMEEEVRRANVLDIVEVFKEIVSYAIAELGAISTEKN